MTVLVTGATGFVGGWIVRRLLAEGIEVRILRRKSSDDLALFDSNKVDVFFGDILNLESLTRACHNVHSVFHLAGVVGYSRHQRLLMERVNVGGTRNVIEACKVASVQRLLHMSSVVAVGSSFDGKTPLNEDSPYNLSHLNLGYFETKRAAELEVVASVQRGELDAVIVNPSTVYGPGDASKGSRKTQVKVAQGKMPFYTQGGVSVAHIEDVVEASVQAWKKGEAGQRYILAGENILIRDLFAMIAAAAGKNAPKIFLPTPLAHGLGKIGDTLERFGLKGPLNSETAWTATLFHWYESAKAVAKLGYRIRPAREALAESVQWMLSKGLVR